MKGTLDLINENDWVVRYGTEEPSGGIVYKSLPLSRFHKIMYKGDNPNRIFFLIRIIQMSYCCNLSLTSPSVSL